MDRDSSSHTTLRVTGFEADVFRQLMEFAHTGRVDLMPRTIIGVISSADYYQFLGRQQFRNKTLSSSVHHYLTDLRDGGLQFFPMCLKVCGLFLNILILG